MVINKEFLVGAMQLVKDMLLEKSIECGLDYDIQINPINDDKSVVIHQDGFDIHLEPIIYETYKKYPDDRSELFFKKDPSDEDVELVNKIFSLAKQGNESVFNHYLIFRTLYIFGCYVVDSNEYYGDYGYMEVYEMDDELREKVQNAIFNGWYGYYEFPCDVIVKIDGPLQFAYECDDINLQCYYYTGKSRKKKGETEFEVVDIASNRYKWVTSAYVDEITQIQINNKTPHKIQIDDDTYMVYKYYSDLEIARFMHQDKVAKLLAENGYPEKYIDRVKNSSDEWICNVLIKFDYTPEKGFSLNQPEISLITNSDEVVLPYSEVEKAFEEYKSNPRYTQTGFKSFRFNSLSQFELDQIRSVNGSAIRL